MRIQRMQRHVLPFLILAALQGCQAVTTNPQAIAPPAEPTHQTTLGTLSAKVLWPSRQIQMIPLSAQTIRLRALNGQAVLGEVKIARAPGGDGAQVAQALMQLNAASGLTVLAEAFREGPQALSTSSVAIASASVSNVSIIANQKTSVTLNLIATFFPTLSSFTPSNGGPGVPVTFSGSFGSSGYYGISFAGTRISASGNSATLSANVPAQAITGTVQAWADGASSSAAGSFQVLSALSVAPSSGTRAVGASMSFSASATDTNSSLVSAPTITLWDVVDPSTPHEFDSSSVGSIDEAGVFTALATGTAWVRAWSGSLAATAEVTVN